MRWFWLIIILLTIVVAFYVALLRPWLCKQPWASGFFDAIEPIERNLWLKSETILWSRYLAALGAALTAAANIDPTLVSMLIGVLPDQYQWVGKFLPLTLTLFGMMGERLRRDTTKPLAVVAMANDAPPEVKAAVARAETANQVAAAVVVESEKQAS
jgi:hypothetical protein